MMRKMSDTATTRWWKVLGLGALIWLIPYFAARALFPLEIANGAMFHAALRAVAQVEKKLGVSIEIIDPRILKPFDWDTVTESVSKTHRLLVVHESWQTCGIGSWIVSGIVERAFFELDAPPQVYSAPDLPVPFAPELEDEYRPDERGIAARIESLLEI